MEIRGTEYSEEYEEYANKFKALLREYFKSLDDAKKSLQRCEDIAEKIDALKKARL